jgi:hypothetical protein
MQRARRPLRAHRLLFPLALDSDQASRRTRRHMAQPRDAVWLCPCCHRRISLHTPAVGRGLGPGSTRALLAAIDLIALLLLLIGGRALRAAAAWSSAFLILLARLLRTRCPLDLECARTKWNDRHQSRLSSAPADSTPRLCNAYVRQSCIKIAADNEIANSCFAS